MRLKVIGSGLIEDVTTTEKETNNRTQYLEEGETSDQLDGGYGWWIVVASFLMQACSFGVTSGFGVYFNHYRSQEFSGQPDSQISLIGTVAPTTIALASMFTGILCDRIGFRVCTLIGLCLAVASFIAASFSTKIWQLALTQGFLFGLGGALLYVPANTLVTRWFFKHRGVAVGIGTAGTGVGGSINSIVNARLLSVLPVAWVLRINGLVIGIILLISFVIIKTPRDTSIKTNTSTSQLEPFKLSSICTLKFACFFFSMLFSGFAYLVPLYYLPSYAVHVGLSKDQGAFLLGAVNVASAVGRILLGFLGDRLGHSRMFFFCLLASSLLPIIWLLSRSFSLLMVFSILYGMTFGGFAGGFPATCAVLFGEAHIGTIMGIVYAPTCIGDLFGPYFGGLILEKSHNYQYVILFAMGLYGLATLFMILILIFCSKNTAHSAKPT